MARMLVILISLVATPLFAAELGSSYVKLFHAQAQIARGGNAGAQYSLGEMYEQGLGTKVSLKQAYQWYEKAASKGDIRAKYKLASRATSVSDEDRMKKALTAPTDGYQKARKRKVDRAQMAKKRARAKALLKKQQARALANDMEEL